MKYKDLENYQRIIVFLGSVYSFIPPSPSYTKIIRRHDSAMTDGSDVQLDLTGVMIPIRK